MTSQKMAAEETTPTLCSNVSLQTEDCLLSQHNLPSSSMPAIKTPPSEFKKAEPYFRTCCKKVNKDNNKQPDSDSLWCHKVTNIL